MAKRRRAAGSKKRRSWHRTQPVPLAAAVGQRITRLAKERDFTFDAIVGETELSRGYFSQLQRGMLVPGIVVLKRIADALETTLAHVVMIDGGLPEQLYDSARKLSSARVEKLLKQAKLLLTEQEQEDKDAAK